MIKESERIRGKMLVLVGIGYLLLGFVLILSTARITGLVVVGNAPEGLGYALSIVFIVVGIVVIVSGRRNSIEGLELRVVKGHKKEEKKITDPEGVFGGKGYVGLSKFRTDIEHYKQTDRPFYEHIKEIYGDKLRQIVESGDEDKAEVAVSFLEVLEPDHKPDTRRGLYVLPDEDQKRIKTAFRPWDGTLSTEQKKVLRDYSLEYKSDGDKSKIYSESGRFVVVGNTTGDRHAGLNNAHHIIDMIQEEKRKKINS